jgi:hypothetical protein
MDVTRSTEKVDNLSDGLVYEPPVLVALGQFGEETLGGVKNRPEVTTPRSAH